MTRVASLCPFGNCSLESSSSSSGNLDKAISLLRPNDQSSSSNPPIHGQSSPLLAFLPFHFARLGKPPFGHLIRPKSHILSFRRHTILDQLGFFCWKSIPDRILSVSVALQGYSTSAHLDAALPLLPPPPLQTFDESHLQQLDQPQVPFSFSDYRRLRFLRVCTPLANFSSQASRCQSFKKQLIGVTLLALPTPQVHDTTLLQIP